MINNTVRLFTIIFLLVCFSLSTSLKGQDFFEFEGKQIAPGSKSHITIPITDGEDTTFIPITVFHGKERGEVLGMTAGVHGYEYAPILAGQALISEIDPNSLKGTVILVQVANVASFFGRSPYVSPLDNKNLNRSFPGKPNGTVTEQIANFITQKVISQCDYFMDMHSGDAPEDLMPYSAYYQHDDKVSISAKGREMAVHLGFDHVIVFKTTEKDYMKNDKASLYCSAEAFKQGIPAVDIECGRLGMIEQGLVDKIVSGVSNLLSYLGMTDDTPDQSGKVTFIEERSYLSSQHSGFFYPLRSSGERVNKGMKVGYITDFFGKVKQEVYANADGIILYFLGTPPVNKGRHWLRLV